MRIIRVLIVDDSAFMRKIIRTIVESDSRLEVVGTARNGKDGIKKIKELTPDVVTMDVNMPVMDGMAALQEIMKENRELPVIMLSSETDKGADNTIKAMEYGAVDFIRKPSGEISLDLDKIRSEIVSKLIAAASATIVPKKRTENPNSPSKLTQNNAEKRFQQEKNKQTVIVIGTSTGGPRALQKLLSNLPENFKTPILIVQHMPPGFTKSLANRLNTLCPLLVKEAEHGEVIQEKTVYIAPGDYHMRIEAAGNRLIINNSKDEPINNHRPSVDALFKSASSLKGVQKIAVILTGMGNDGSGGIKAIKQQDKGSVVLSESSETAVIYGMPKAAFETNVVDQVLPINQIGNYLGQLTS
jgi:two-component system chemotaxis response regulator CheB